MTKCGWYIHGHETIPTASRNKVWTLEEGPGNEEEEQEDFEEIRGEVMECRDFSSILRTHYIPSIDPDYDRSMEPCNDFSLELDTRQVDAFGFGKGTQFDNGHQMN